MLLFSLPIIKFTSKYNLSLKTSWQQIKKIYDYVIRF